MARIPTNMRRKPLVNIVGGTINVKIRAVINTDSMFVTALKSFAKIKLAIKQTTTKIVEEKAISSAEYGSFPVNPMTVAIHARSIK
jgi:hypothetical protein